MDLRAFLVKISIWAVPVLFAITLHEVAHGSIARLFGDRTAELLGRLSLNPLRHIDPLGTLIVPCVLLAIGVPPIGWAKPVPVATSALRHPRRALVWVALAGPGANLLMALVWCAILGAVVHANASQTLVGWVEYMAQAGIFINIVLAVVHLLPVPPLDCGRVVAGLLPPHLGARLEKVEPFGWLVVVGLSVLRMLDWLFEPALRVIGRVITVLLGSSA